MENLNYGYCEAPRLYTRQAEDGPSVFLAGGISNITVPWHRTAIDRLSSTRDTPVIIFNPNRRNFPINDPNAAAEQVAWEQTYLHQADITMFWFPESDPARTTQPIAMFELGQALGEGRKIVVGASPKYPRTADVHLQCGYNRPALTVWSTLEDTLVETIQLVRAELADRGC